MLEYGDTFLEQNREALDQLEDMMGSAAFQAALAMAPEYDDVDLQDELPEAA